VVAPFLRSSSYFFFSKATLSNFVVLMRKRSGKVAWQIVWCHERGHKQENQPRRQAFNRVSRELDATLTCLRKASQFSDWIQRPSRTVYVLVTDWREAQPCLQALVQNKADTRPVFSVVICDTQKQFNRASEFSRTLAPEAGIVHICERDDIPKEILAGLIHQVFGQQPPPKKPGLIGSLPPELMASKVDCSNSTCSSSTSLSDDTGDVSGVSPSDDEDDDDDCYWDEGSVDCSFAELKCRGPPEGRVQGGRHESSVDLGMGKSMHAYPHQHDRAAAGPMHTLAVPSCPYSMPMIVVPPCFSSKQATAVMAH